MEFLGIGPSELIFIILIAIIVLGPKDMQKAGRTVGRWLNQLVRSEGWKTLQQTSRVIRGLPGNLMREANMELQEAQKDINKALDTRPGRSIASPSGVGMPPSKEAENSIQPPVANSEAPSNSSEAKVEDGTESTSNQHG